MLKRCIVRVKYNILVNNFFMKQNFEEKIWERNSRFGLAKKIWLVLGSLLAGVCTGLFGGGGGMLVVPLLTMLYGLEQDKAHATALATIFPLCLVSSIFYLVGAGWEYKNGLIVTLGVVVGGIIGSFALRKIPKRMLQFVFYILMIIGGIKMIIG